MATLITGGLGHVGSWVARKLIDQGEEVIIGDVIVNNFEKMDFDYLEQVEDKFSLEYLDVMDFSSITEVFNKYKNKITGVIHTVALDPAVEAYKSINVNTFGTLNMLEATKIFGIKKFVFISTGAVYGNTPGPISEDTPYNPTDIYGASKVSSELIALQYGEKYNIDVRCPRIFFVYGAGKLPTRMNGLHKGLFAPLAGLKNLSFDKGKDTFADFTYVEDAAEGIIKVYLAETLNHKIYNITSGIAISATEIMEAVSKVIGYNPNVNFGDGPWLNRGAPLDISRAQTELNFHPRFTDIEKGIENYYLWTENIMSKRSVT